MMKPTKEQLKEFALKKKQDTGQFPKGHDWLVKDGYPCGRDYISKLFEGYNNFRIFCEEPILQRKEAVTLEWIKSQCLIDEKQCWNWQKALTQNGNYGSVGAMGKQWYVHRLTYTLVHGEIESPSIFVRHMCNNKQCCNPDHLQLGSQRENQLDTETYGRAFKLKREEVILIKQAILTADFSQKGSKRQFDKEWAAKYNVQPQAIEGIRLNNTWTHIQI